MAQEPLTHCSGCSCHLQRPLADHGDSPPSYDQATRKISATQHSGEARPQRLLALDFATNATSAARVTWQPPQVSQAPPQDIQDSNTPTNADPAVWSPIHRQETPAEGQKRSDIYRGWITYVLSRQEGHFAKFWMMLRLFKYELEYGTIGAMYMASKLLQNDPEDQALKWHAGCGEKCAIHYDIYCYCVHVGKRGTLYNAKSTVVESVLGVPREVSRLDILAAVNGEPCPEHGMRTCYCAVTKDEETGEMKATDIRPKVVGVRWHFESTHSL